MRKSVTVNDHWLLRDGSLVKLNVLDAFHFIAQS